MDFHFSDDQDALRDGVRSFLAAEAAGAYVRAMAEDPRGFTDEFWAQVVELGWPGLHIAEEHGGSGYGLEELVVVVEELGRAVSPGPFVATVIASATIAAAGDEPSSLGCDVRDRGPATRPYRDDVRVHIEQSSFDGRVPLSDSSVTAGYVLSIAHRLGRRDASDAGRAG